MVGEAAVGRQAGRDAEPVRGAGLLLMSEHRLGTLGGGVFEAGRQL